MAEGGGVADGGARIRACGGTRPSEAKKEGAGALKGREKKRMHS